MARKKKIVEPPMKFSKEELQAALEISHSEYFMQVIALMSHDETLNELDYVKVPITTPNGGVYLISVLHIEGPKVSLKDLAKAAEEVERGHSEG